jgi:hypothetical protein
MIMVTNMNRAVGRPLGLNEAKTIGAKAFFDTAEEAGLSLKQTYLILLDKLERCPSYRTLQEWRRGTYEPSFAPFEIWSQIILNQMSESGISRKHGRI